MEEQNLQRLVTAGTRPLGSIAGESVEGSPMFARNNTVLGVSLGMGGHEPQLSDTPLSNQLHRGFASMGGGNLLRRTFESS
jgi:hypothetical protein